MIICVRPKKRATQCIDLVSHLAVEPTRVWQRIASVEGINTELWPIRMHLPRELETLRHVATGSQRQGVLITLCGLIPLDWHWLGIESVTPGEGFRERSSSLWMREWVHVRTIQSDGTGCTLHDRAELTPRLGLLAVLLVPLYRAIFHRRHRQLRRQFGGSS